MVNSISEDMTNDKNSRDGLARDLFPLTGDEQKKYDFQLKGVETYKGRRVLRITFKPKPHPTGDTGSWKGEALIDAEEYQPVLVNSSLAFGIPMAVRILLGTNIRGLGFSVSYQKFADGVWFPVSYGGEFEVRAVFFYKRTISVRWRTAISAGRMFPAKLPTRLKTKISDRTGERGADRL